MKKMNYAEPFIDGYNAVVGTIVAVLSYILGEHWVLFVAFLLLNVADWLTGWMKSRIAGKAGRERWCSVRWHCPDSRKRQGSRRRA